MSDSIWRRAAKRAIGEVVSSKPLDQWTEKELRTALRNAYPFGPRSHWPYKVWLKAVNETVRTICGQPEQQQPVDFGLFAERENG